MPRFPLEVATATRTPLRVSRWHRFVWHACRHLYYSRVVVRGREHLPDGSRPVLFLGLHRNGAVDGFVYGSALDAPVFLISTQLRKNAIARLFFSGITVVRDKDAGDREGNDAVLQLCRDHLRAGGRLFVLPEGTSALGPRHLPFRSGAARLVRDYLGEVGAPPLVVLPLGIHYECAWAFRSRVEILVGPPLPLDFPAEASPRDLLRELRRRMTESLEHVGVNVPTAEWQALAERTAYAATLGTARSYTHALKRLERALPAEVEVRWRELEADPAAGRLLRHQGVPLVPVGSVAGYGLALLVLGPLVLAGIAVNLPPLLAGWGAGRRLADDRNVIALWRLLVGAPAFAGWGLVVVVAAFVTGHPVAAAAYAVLTIGAWWFYYRAKKLAVAVGNAMRGVRVRSRLLALYEAILRALPDETT